MLLFTCLTGIILLSSCNEQGVDYDTSIEMSQPPVSPGSIDSSVLNDATIQQMPSPSVVPFGVSGSGLALNPEHGKPGHRCDIAVGAPLNSPGQQPTAPAPQLTPRSPINTSGAVSLNPPHGQPGHDCAIPVGQPLKS